MTRTNEHRGDAPKKAQQGTNRKAHAFVVSGWSTCRERAPHSLLRAVSGLTASKGLSQRWRASDRNQRGASLGCADWPPGAVIPAPPGRGALPLAKKSIHQGTMERRTDRVPAGGVGSARHGLSSRLARAWIKPLRSGSACARHHRSRTRAFPASCSGVARPIRRSAPTAARRPAGRGRSRW